jgi:hypothetical protein
MTIQLPFQHFLLCTVSGCFFEEFLACCFVYVCSERGVYR